MTSLRIRLRELREQRGLSQQALADLADVRQGTVSDIETGKGRRVDLDILERLAAALNVSPSELFEDEPEKRRRKR